MSATLTLSPNHGGPPSVPGCAEQSTHPLLGLGPPWPCSMAGAVTSRGVRVLSHPCALLLSEGERPPASLSLLIALLSLVCLIVSDKQPSPEDMSGRCWLLVQRGKHSSSPSVARAFRGINTPQPPGWHEIRVWCSSVILQMRCADVTIPRNQNLQRFHSEKGVSSPSSGFVWQRGRAPRGRWQCQHHLCPRVSGQG